MEDFGDIIYFLIIIVLGILGSLGKKKKKMSSKVDTQTTQNPNTPSVWEELERQLRKQTEAAKKEVSTAFETIQKPQKSHAPERERQTKEYMSYETVDDVNKLRVRNQIKGTISRSQSGFKMSPITGDAAPDTAPFEVSFDDYDDVKKAFVYSEIFNRKYV